jgi:putative acetyltransferase
MQNLHIRTIEPRDEQPLACIIRDTLAEFGANKPGTVYFDDTTDHLWEVFKKAKSIYFVAQLDGAVVGGSGVYPTDGLPPGTCELVKLYLAPVARGKGIGKLLLDKCTAAAKELGYSKMYLETMPELKVAIPMYERAGFTFLDGPRGNSGHTGCDIWMMKDLS